MAALGGTAFPLLHPHLLHPLHPLNKKKKKIIIINPSLCSFLGSEVMDGAEH